MICLHNHVNGSVWHSHSSEFYLSTWLKYDSIFVNRWSAPASFSNPGFPEPETRFCLAIFYYNYQTRVFLKSWNCCCIQILVSRSEIPSCMCTKLRTVAASNNRVHMPWSLYYCLFAPHTCMVLFFTHIPFVVNHTFNATPPERLQHYWFW